MKKKPDLQNEDFKNFVLDQLDGIPNLTCRRMFGGYGLYYEHVYFAILYKGQLFFRTNAQTRPRYLERGMKPFQPGNKPFKNYHAVPVEILEDKSALAEWTEAAIDAGFED